MYYNKKLSPDIKKKKKKSSSEIASETLSPEDIYRIVRLISGDNFLL